MIPKVPICGYLARVDIPQDQCEEYGYPFKYNETVLILGEIEHMPGHCAVVADGKIYYAYHTDDFVKLSEDEV